MGSAGASHETPGALNVNKQTVEQRGIRNHVEFVITWKQMPQMLGSFFGSSTIDLVVGILYASKSYQLAIHISSNQ